MGLRKQRTVQWTCESDERREPERAAEDPAKHWGGILSWLGRKGSNLRMLESKSSALPLGDAPSCGQGRDHIEGAKRFQRGEWAEIPRFWLVAGAGVHRYKGAPARWAQRSVWHIGE